MGFLSKLFSKSGTGLLSEINGILDTVITTDKERQEAKYKMKALYEKYKAKAMQEVSKRHKYDMNSDSFLSKNVRPFLVLFSLFVVTLFAIVDGSTDAVNIPPAYLDIINQVLLGGIAFYFGARSFDKKKVTDALKELKLEREKTIQKSMDKNINLEKADLPSISLSQDNE